MCFEHFSRQMFWLAGYKESQGPERSKSEVRDVRERKRERRNRKCYSTRLEWLTDGVPEGTESEGYVSRMEKGGLVRHTPVPGKLQSAVEFGIKMVHVLLS